MRHLIGWGITGWFAWWLVSGGHWGAICAILLLMILGTLGNAQGNRSV